MLRICQISSTRNNTQVCLLMKNNHFKDYQISNSNNHNILHKASNNSKTLLMTSQAATLRKVQSTRSLKEWTNNIMIITTKDMIRTSNSSTTTTAMITISRITTNTMPITIIQTRTTIIRKTLIMYGMNTLSNGSINIRILINKRIINSKLMTTTSTIITINTNKMQRMHRKRKIRRNISPFIRATKIQLRKLTPTMTTGKNQRKLQPYKMISSILIMVQRKNRSIPRAKAICHQQPHSMISLILRRTNFKQTTRANTICLMTIFQAQIRISNRINSNRKHPNPKINTVISLILESNWMYSQTK